MKGISLARGWRKVLKLWCIGSGVWLVYALCGVVWTLTTDDYARGTLFDRDSVFPVLAATGIDVFGPPCIVLALLAVTLVIVELIRLAFARAKKLGKLN